jgi:hypothetical protein
MREQALTTSRVNTLNGNNNSTTKVPKPTAPDEPNTLELLRAIITFTAKCFPEAADQCTSYMAELAQLFGVVSIGGIFAIDMVWRKFAYTTGGTLWPMPAHINLRVMMLIVAFARQKVEMTYCTNCGNPDHSYNQCELMQVQFLTPRTAKSGRSRTPAGPTNAKQPCRDFKTPKGCSRTNCKFSHAA